MNRKRKAEEVFSDLAKETKRIKSDDKTDNKSQAIEIINYICNKKNYKYQSQSDVLQTVELFRSSAINYINNGGNILNFCELVANKNVETITISMKEGTNNFTLSGMMGPCTNFDNSEKQISFSYEKISHSNIHSDMEF
jgi:hypothetical protein